MEIILVLAVLGGLFWWLLLRSDTSKNQESTLAPYKVETPPVSESVAAPIEIKVEEPVPTLVPETVVEKPKRAKRRGKFVADDKTTPDVNEAWEDGKTPAKKSRKPHATKAEKPAKAAKEKTTKKVVAKRTVKSQKA
jgi:hypothetical protein